MGQGAVHACEFAILNVKYIPIRCARHRKELRKSFGEALYTRAFRQYPGQDSFVSRLHQILLPTNTATGSMVRADRNLAGHGMVVWW